MEIVSQFGANYLVCDPLEYKPQKEVLYFGETKIIPGTKISKIGEKKRTSFEAAADSFFQYDGTIKLGKIKYCLFSSTWEDIPEEPVYRYAFAMEETNKPVFLYLQSKNGNSGFDIDSRKVTLKDQIN